MEFRDQKQPIKIGKTKDRRRAQSLSKASGLGIGVVIFCYTNKQC